MGKWISFFLALLSMENGFLRKNCYNFSRLFDYLDMMYPIFERDKKKIEMTRLCLFIKNQVTSSNIFWPITSSNIIRILTSSRKPRRG